MKTMVHVIASTHMDREWYASGEEFRYQLCQILDRVIELLDKHTKFIYMLDGQASLVADYLEIYPERKAVLERFVAERRLLIGPWYIQPDEFLVCGESHIRNLLMGREACSVLGTDRLNVGYLPDSFGHIAQMPQILRGFGIQDAFLMRGVAADVEREFTWVAPDGSRVLAIHFPYQSFTVHDPDRMENGLILPEGPESFVAAIAQLERNDQFPTKTGELLLTYNCDHLPPRASVVDDVQAANRDLADHSIVFSSLENLFARTRAQALSTPEISGELRDGDDIRYLKDTAASRTYLKIANRETENLLVNFVEPLSALAWLAGGADPAPFLRQAWKYLLLNHTHDGICGCSIDKVHDEMMTRFHKALHLGRMILDRQVAPTLTCPATEPLGAGESMAVWLYSPRPGAGRAVVDVDLKYHGFGDALGAAEIRDVSGNQLEFQVLSDVDHESIEWEFETVQRFRRGRRAHIVVDMPSLPSVGYTTLFLSPRDKTAVTAAPGSDDSLIGAEGGTLENAVLRVCVNANGTFDIIDKDSGARYDGLHNMVDGGDGGDVYNYRPPATDSLLSSTEAPWQMSLVANGPLLARIELRASMHVPASLRADRSARTDDAVATDIVTTLTLRRASRTVEVRSTITNRALDHRLRVHFPTDLHTDTVYDDGQFYLNRRGLRDFPTLHPSQNFVAIDDGRNGLAIFNKGVGQYEVLDDGRNSLALTLFRCSDVLYRRWFDTRLEDFGGAQNIGTWTYEYAIHPYVGSALGGSVKSAADVYNAGYYQRIVQTQSGVAPAEYSFLRIGPDEWILDALHKHSRRDSVVIRFHNSAARRVRGVLEISGVVTEAYRLDLGEDRLRRLTVDGNDASSTILLDVAGHRIITLELVLDRSHRPEL